MIADHKGKTSNELLMRQDTTKNKSSLLLIESPQADDSAIITPKKDLLINKKGLTFKPLPTVDSVRFNPKPKKKYYDPLKTAEYLKYKNSKFTITDEGTLFTKKSFDQNKELQKILVSKKKSIPAKQVPTEEVKEFTEIIEDSSFLSQNFIIESSAYKRTNTTGWTLGLLIFITILFAWIQVFNAKFVRNIRSAIFNNQWAKKLYEERNVVSQRVSFFLNVLFLLNTSLLVMYIMTFFNYAFDGLTLVQSYLLVFTAISALYLGKYILLHVLSWLILAQKEIGEYIHNVFLFNKIYGLVLFPVIWIVPFIDEKMAVIFLYAAIGLFGILYIMRIFRGIYNSIRLNVSIFYLILYLCALEIFPMLLLYKAITSMM